MQLAHLNNLILLISIFNAHSKEQAIQRDDCAELNRAYRVSTLITKNKQYNTLQITLFCNLQISTLIPKNKQCNWQIIRVLVAACVFQRSFKINKQCNIKALKEAKDAAQFLRSLQRTSNSTYWQKMRPLSTYQFQRSFQRTSNTTQQFCRPCR